MLHVAYNDNDPVYHTPGSQLEAQVSFHLWKIYSIILARLYVCDGHTYTQTQTRAHTHADAHTHSSDKRPELRPLLPAALGIITGSPAPGAGCGSWWEVGMLPAKG